MGFIGFGVRFLGKDINLDFVCRKLLFLSLSSNLKCLKFYGFLGIRRLVVIDFSVFSIES